MTVQQATSERRESLETAFNLFNQLSEELTGSYRELQLQVLELSQELAAARNERMLHLAEKEQLADRLERLLETLPAAVIVLDDAGKVKEFNPAAGRLLESIRLEADWQQLLALRSQPDLAAKNELHLLNGKILSVSSRRLEQAPGLILVMLDVTETRLLQERLNRQERLGAMGQMSAQLAHQMRTPLSSALLYASHLSNDHLTQEQRYKFSTKLRTRLQHMERQISDILLFARGSSVGIEQISLSRLVEEFADNMASELHQAKARLQLECNTHAEVNVLGRKDALLGVLSNLTDNALQHGASEILLTLDAGEQITLRFKDNGSGIPEEYRQQIFDPFFTTRSAGTGLGLAIVQNLMLSHNAEICLADSDEGGTEFALNFPPVDAKRSSSLNPFPYGIPNKSRANQPRSLS